PDRRLANLVIDSKLAHGFASSVALGDFPALTRVEHGLAAKHGALGFGSLDAFIIAVMNQLALAAVAHASRRALAHVRPLAVRLVRPPRAPQFLNLFGMQCLDRGVANLLRRVNVSCGLARASSMSSVESQVLVIE